VTVSTTLFRGGVTAPLPSWSGRSVFVYMELVRIWTQAYCALEQSTTTSLRSFQTLRYEDSAAKPENDGAERLPALTLECEVHATEPVRRQAQVMAMVGRQRPGVVCSGADQATSPRSAFRHNTTTTINVFRHNVFRHNRLP